MTQHIPRATRARPAIKIDIEPAAHDRDHERDVDLALAGYKVRRFTYQQVRDRPAKVAATVRRALGLS